MFTPSISVDESVSRFIKKLRKVNDKINEELIAHAYRFSWFAHKGQTRESGDPFLAHSVAVALILAGQNLDEITVAAGLLHDVVEDTEVTVEDIREEFGEEISLLVDGVTKIKSFHISSRKQRQAETYRKMLLSMARDLRVIIIKFADRIHNLRTLKYLKPEKVKQIAQETLDIYAPLAHRLGMARIKSELEDLAFKFLHPEDYNSIVSKITENRHKRERIIDSFAIPVRKELENQGVKATIIGRPKNFYSIYRKMVERNRSFDEIYDLLAIRILTDSVMDCYLVLGIVHSLWRPIQDRFKDYISLPKANGYQSLHTTVMGNEGKIVEIQIRTWEMNQTAEDGIAAHWLYKSGGEIAIRERDRAISWLKNLIEWQKGMTDSAEFMEFFKVDLFHTEIFVFTPKGDLITLAKGSTVLDFAFAVHTELGLHCIGAKIDNTVGPVYQVLKSGSTVEVLHHPDKTPSTEWFTYVRTPKARSAIRRWLKKKGRQESIDLGKDIIKSVLRKNNIRIDYNEHIDSILRYLKVSNQDALFEKVGNGDIPVSRILSYFKDQLQIKTPGVVTRIVNSITGKKNEVLVGGDHKDVMVRYATCCRPVPGDEIIGFATKGRGISIHRTTCPNVKIFEDDPDRIIIVNWRDRELKKRDYEAVIEIVAADKFGLLSEITDILKDYGVQIRKLNAETRDHHVIDLIHIRIKDKKQLDSVIGRLRRISSVEQVERKNEGFLLEKG